ncbi:MAG: prepilin-type N-terminal cleavage/methylation domain-containing protein [Rhodocyclaceae bacterium]|nr:prepilin-type N-terminal cleavage/methylation domain-containing protein [Rhodocyclaceae bacterium]
MRRISDVAALRGFTLIELIVAMVLTGILAAAAAVFLRVPIAGYFDLARRAALTDIADLAVRRFSRDVQTALPNSVRVAGACTGLTTCYLEYLEVRTGGRYREEPAGGATTCPAGAGAYTDTLQIGIADTCFRSLGPVPDLAGIATGAATGDFLVVYNLGPGFAGADAYASGAVTGGNKSRITAVAAGAGSEDMIVFQPLAFPLASPDNRFHVVSGPVTYICDPVAGTLTRQWGYAIGAAQGTPPAGGVNALLANGVTGCSFTYNPNVVAQRNGTVSIRLELTQTDPAGTPERVTLFSQVHVSNVP